MVVVVELNGAVQQAKLLCGSVQPEGIFLAALERWVHLARTMI